MNLHPLIFRDHYRRWWWAHLVGFLLFAAIGVAVGCVVDLDPSGRRGLSGRGHARGGAQRPDQRPHPVVVARP